MIHQEGISMPDSIASRHKTKFTVLKLCGTSLLWVGLAALVYVPTSGGGTIGTIVAIAGFLSFASGLLMLLDGLKGELIQQINCERMSS
jgi:hypothetical protein